MKSDARYRTRPQRRLTRGQHLPQTLVYVSVIVACVSVIPIFFLGYRALSNGVISFVQVLIRERSIELFWNTILLGAIVSIASAILGTITAWTVTRISLYRPRFWITLVCLPLGVPSFVSAFAWITAFPTFTGIIPLAILMTLVSTPFVTVPVMAALTQIDHAQADVARTLGRRRIYVFFTITLPQIAPAIGAGSIIVALYTISDFGAPALMRYETLTTGVYGQVIAGVSKHSPAGLAILIMLIAATLVIVENLLRRRSYRSSTHSYQPPAQQLSLTGQLAVSAVVLVIAGVSIIAPLAALFYRWIVHSQTVTDWDRIAQAGLTTIILASLAATIATLASLAIAYLTARLRHPVLSIIEAATFMGHALPGVVLALAMVSFTLTVIPWAYQSLPTLIVTYVFLFMPKGIGAARSGFHNVSVEAEEVARTLEIHLFEYGHEYQSRAQKQGSSPDGSLWLRRL